MDTYLNILLVIHQNQNLNNDYYIKKLNNLTSNTLSIGQVLLLPGTTEENTVNTYTVKKGDTLYGIASKYNLR